MYSPIRSVNIHLAKRCLSPDGPMLSGPPEYLLEKVLGIRSFREICRLIISVHFLQQMCKCMKCFLKNKLNIEYHKNSIRMICAIITRLNMDSG